MKLSAIFSLRTCARWGLPGLTMACASIVTWQPVMAADQPVIQTPAPHSLSAENWQTVTAFTKSQAQTADTEEVDAQTLRLQRQAEIRARLQPPLLPVAINTAAPVPKAAVAPVQIQAANTAAAARATQMQLISKRSQETVATLEALKVALKQVGASDRVLFTATRASD